MRQDEDWSVEEGSKTWIVLLALLQVQMEMEYDRRIYSIPQMNKTSVQVHQRKL